MQTPPSLSRSGSVYTIDQTLDEIVSYLTKAGTESYLGEQEEAVTQLSHALQAAQQAHLYSDDEEIIIAALLHDIGHMILARPDVWDPAAKGEDVTDDNGLQSEQHEWVGYHYLIRHGFSQKIADLVLGHVQAKRYLTYKDAAYYDRLSYTSRMTLIGQGGPFTAAQAQAFEQNPLYQVKIRMREWDEAAKEAEWQSNGHEIEEYTEMIHRHLLLQQHNRNNNTTNNDIIRNNINTYTITSA